MDSDPERPVLSEPFFKIPALQKVRQTLVETEWMV